MKLYPYLKSILEEDRCAVVICNLKHEIIYMNPAAKEQYVKWGGAELWEGICWNVTTTLHGR